MLAPIAIMAAWMENEFHPLIKKHEVPLGHIHNGDQTGLFCQKLPNRLHVPEDKKKDFKGSKQMKSKARVAAMVATSADGKKVPLSLVGKCKNPKSFSLCENNNPPMACISQRNVWFNKDVAEWWIRKVFWPHH